LNEQIPCVAFESLAGAPEIVQPNGLSPNDLDIEWMTSTNEDSPDSAALRSAGWAVHDRFPVTEFISFPRSSLTHIAQVVVGIHPYSGIDYTGPLRCEVKESTI